MSTVTPNQRMFSKAYIAFVYLGASPSMRDYLVGGNTLCAYRGENGAKCAIGISMPNRVYNPKFESRPIRGFPDITTSPVVINWINRFDLNFADDLQACHDDAAHGSRFRNGEYNMQLFRQYFTTGAERVAKNYGLKIPRNRTSRRKH